MKTRTILAQALLTSLLLAGLASAQSSSNPSVPVPSNSRGKTPSTQPKSPPATVPAPKVEPKGSVGAVMLADEPLRLESVGLTVHIPEGTRVESSRSNGRQITQLIEQNGLWIMNIQTPLTSNEAATIQQATDQTLSLLQGSVGVVDPNQETVQSTEAKVLQRDDNVQLPGGSAARLYVSLPEMDHKSRVVKGYTIFKPGPKQFVVFELLCGEVNFGAARVAYEASVATAQFVNSDELAMARMTSVKAGTALLLQLSEQDWLNAMEPEGKEQWYRMYRPGKDGSRQSATEVGYYGVRYWRGMRGEIDGTKRATDFNATERQQGYLVRVRSRIINGKAIADNDGTFFMTTDRSEEAWSFKTAAREVGGKQSALASESGARTADDLQIIKNEPGKATMTIKPPVKEGYMSQFETFVMPRILAQRGIEGDFGWYAYEAWPSGTVTYRKDVVIKDKSEKQTRVVTTIRPDAPSQTSVFDDVGRLVGTQLTDDGLVREPIDLATLKQIWQQKGLPTDK